MSATPISLSPDLQQLEADGLRLRIILGVAKHLLIDGIPAVTAERKVVLGTLYCPLDLDSELKVVNPPASHQCWWIGEAPCDHTGRRMDEMISNPGPEPKGDEITTTVGFSRKPVVNGAKVDHANLYEKVWTYIDAIWHEAREVDPTCDPRSEKPVPAVVEAQDRAFHYPDMATTRAGIGAATAKLLAERVAIIGVGGTGSYILDLIAKTPVAEIHIFDGDAFEVHNAFRSPGAPRKEELTDPAKVDWFGDIYDRMHKGVKRHGYYVTADNIGELAGFDFVFVAIDNGEARKVILDGLIANDVSFIDAGMDVGIEAVALRGICRFTVGTAQKHDHLEEVISFAKAAADDVYRNIQVADLNMLNAALAVGKWKKLRGFYADDVREHHSTYTIATSALLKEDRL